MQTGTSFRIKVNSGTVGTPVQTYLNCEGSFTLTITNNIADTSGKCDVWNTGLITSSAWTVSGSGHYEENDTGVDKIRDALMTRTTMTSLQMLTFGGEVFSGTVNFDSFEITAERDGVVDFSFSAQGDSTLSVT